MAAESFDVFCPTCNILVSAQVRADVSHGFRSAAISEIDMPDAEYHSEHYSLAFCGRCEEPFLIRESLYGIPAEFETVTRQVVLYPAGNRLVLSDIPEPVASSHDQAIRAFGTGLYEPAALMCRKALEAICRLKGASGKSLYERLTELKAAGVIDARLLEWAHEIRGVGNEAAHGFSIDVTKEDARDVLDLTEAILLYVFSLTARFERFQARRAGSAVTKPSVPAG